MVADFPESECVKPFRDVFNKHGPFADRSTAETFLGQYRKHNELDYDSPFDVLKIMEAPI